MRTYEVYVEWTAKRQSVVAVKAPSPNEATPLAKDPSNWLACFSDDDEEEVEIEVVHAILA